MAFTQPTLPLRSGPLVTNTAVVNTDDMDAVMSGFASASASDAISSSSGLSEYVANHPLLRSFGLVMTWGDGNAPVISGGGGSTRPTTGLLYPRGNN